MVEQRGVSLLPDDFIQGGLLDDIDGRIKTARWVEFDYGGKGKPTLALHVCILHADGEEDAYYSCGDLSRMQPNNQDGGKTLLPVDGHIIKGTKAAWFLESIIAAGFPRNDLGVDVSAFDSTECHFLRKADPERPGLANQRDASKGPATTLLVKTIISLPKEVNALNFVGGGVNPSQAVGAPAGAPAGAGNPAPAPPAVAAAADYGQKAEEHILNVLAQKGGAITKAELPAALIASCAASGDVAIQGGIVGQAYRNEWVGDAARPWKVDTNGGLSL